VEAIEMANIASEDDDTPFLGRWFVPIVLAAVVLCLLISVSISEAELGFLLTATIVAFSLTLRYTWNMRSAPGYSVLLGVLGVIHLLGIALFYKDFSRASGAIYMIAAFADALFMTGVVVVGMHRWRKN
jgi:hypothetical protein